MSARVHELKTWAVYWDAVEDGDKNFEVRKNDRFFQPGDTVKLRRWNPGRVPACYETRDGECSHFVQERGTLLFTIGAILQGGQFGLEPGYCAFSLLPLSATNQRDAEHDG